MQSKSKATAVTNLEHTFSLFADVLVSPFLLQHARQQTSQKNRLCLSKISKLRFLDYFVSRHTTHSMLRAYQHLYVPPLYSDQKSTQHSEFLINKNTGIYEELRGFWTKLWTCANTLFHMFFIILFSFLLRAAKNQGTKQDSWFYYCPKKSDRRSTWPQ